MMMLMMMMLMLMIVTMIMMMMIPAEAAGVRGAHLDPDSLRQNGYG